MPPPCPEEAATPRAWREGAGPRALRASWALLAVALAGYTVTTVPGVRAERGFDVLVDGWVQNAILVTAALLVALRTLVAAENRLAWVSMAAGLAAYAAGNILYFGWVQYDEPLPYPSVADAAWLAVYPFQFVAVMVLARKRVRIRQRTVWLDAAVAALGVSAAATMWLHFIHMKTQGELTAVVMTMAYPVADLVLLLVVIGTSSLMGWRPDRQWVLVGAGLALFAAADTLYVIRVANGSYEAGTMLDPLWAVAAVAIAAAALCQNRPLPEAQDYGWSVLAVPSVLVLAALALLVAGTTIDLPAVSILLATLTVLAGLARAAVTFRDVQSLAGSREQARTDELTGLGNRRHFYEAVEEQIATLKDGEHLAVLLLDLDRFKDVNDALGHSVGDRLLVEVGNRLSSHLRLGDVLVRLGGDEFAIMLTRTGDRLATALAQRLLRGLEEPTVVDGMTVYISASIGIAVCPDVATSVDGLLQRADIAMYEAKADRRGVVVFETRDADLTSRLRSVDELRRAIHEDQLVLHYQPKIDLGTGLMDGVEALVRWDHPEHGLLAPDTFIPQAERYGFMRLLTANVLQQALDQVRCWRDGDGPRHVAVNVSASSLLDTDLPNSIRTMLQERSLPGDALIVEITEDLLMVDPPRSLSVLRGLRDQGVRISIDDYGTGYSSLARLRDLPVSELKLDRSFIAEIERDPKAAAIVESTVRLAHSLGLKLVAEGVEGPATARALARMGCDIAQGFHFGRPSEAAAFGPGVTRMVPAQRTSGKRPGLTDAL